MHKHLLFVNMSSVQSVWNINVPSLANLVLFFSFSSPRLLILLCMIFNRPRNLLRTFVPKSSHTQIFLNLPRRKVMINYCQKGKKNWGEHAPKNTLNLKNRALVDKATVSVIPKILQLDLWIEMFSAKCCLSGLIKWI